MKIDFLILIAADPNVVTAEIQADLVLNAHRMLKSGKVRLVIREEDFTGTISTTGNRYSIAGIVGHQFDVNLALNEDQVASVVNMRFILGADQLPPKQILIDMFSRGSHPTDEDNDFGGEWWKN